MAKKKTTKSPTSIVAIGASAGGLDPYERFFDITKNDAGAAYVIIQHLSPNFQSMMDELLSRHSSMNIERVVDGLELEPNTIYLNPPRTEMTIEGGKFKLSEYNDDKLLNLPIDTFFTSLAIEAGENALVVVLSGTGSDGTKGAQAIKDTGGMVFAQDLASAKFDGMPGSIIKLGIADAVGTPEMLAENVGRVLRGLPVVADPNLGVIKEPAQRIFHRLRERFGTEFNYYKTATIDRRLERRASLRNLNMEDYADVVANEPAEAEALYGDLLIEVTSFFRDPDAFEQMRTKVVPHLAKEMSKTKPVRIWVPGCASGEEAYSFAILFADYARSNNIDLHLKIMATDIHHRSLDKASTGIFDAEHLSGLSQEQLNRYFDQIDDKFQIKPYMRRMVVFSPHNILKDAPFTRMDLVSCRNVLIYLNDVAQQKTLALFHFALRKDGFLFLGPSETTGKLDSEFKILDGKWRIFQKKRDVRLIESVSLLPLSGLENDGFDAQNIRAANTLESNKAVIGASRHAHNDTLKELLRRYAPPGVLVNSKGEVAHVFGNAGDFLSVESGAFSNKIVDLVDNDLKMIISTGLERLRAPGRHNFERRVLSHNEELGQHSVIITIETMTAEDAPEAFFLVTLERVKPKEDTTTKIAKIPPMEASEAARAMQSRIDELERELRATEESLQSTIEELETSNEELQATNEELMASNEELQSTNEELHSVNEELFTVSTEHQSKIQELMEATDDMDHLLRATDIGIMFLDDKLQIRRFTPSAKEVFNIIVQDVGRPVDHITYRFEDFGLKAVIDNVHQKGEVFEREIEVEDRTFVIRVLPYRSSMDEILGVVITAINITEVKMAELARMETTRKYEAIVKDLTDFLLRWSPKTNLVTYANQTCSDILEKPVDNIVGSEISKVGAHGKTKSIFAKLTNIESDMEFKDEILRYDASGKAVYISGTVRPIFDKDGKIEMLQATGRNVTDQYRYRQSLERLLQVRETAVVGQEMDLIEDLLVVGCDFLDMPRASLLEEDGDYFRVLYSHGPQEYQVGQKIPLKRSILDNADSDHKIVAIDGLEKTKGANASIQKTLGIKSNLSIQITAAGKDFGRLAFADTDARSEPFSEPELMFLRLLRNSVETLIERSELLRDDIEYRRQHYINVYDQAPIMRCTLDSTGKILEANAVWSETLGYSGEESIGAPFKDFISDELFPKRWPKFPRFNHEGDSKQEVTITFETTKNDMVICELTATRLLEPRKNETHYLISMVDVTEKKRSFERIERQKRELEKANEGLSTFAYVASHDLQEPLRKIRQYVEMLQQDCKDLLNKDGNYYLDVITGSAARISYLVKDILAYTTAANADIKITNLHLNDIIQDVTEEAAEAVAKKNAKVTVGKLPSIQGDWGAVKLLFQNLVSNGLKYQAKGNTPKISIKSRELKSSYVIDVTDNGIGIADIKDKDVFEPFVRLHSKFEYSGTGIGLAICKAVCERMNWELSHKPNPKGGTIFSIVIQK